MAPYRQIRIRNQALLLAVLLGLLATLFATGCTEVKGGTAAQAKSSSTITGGTEWHEGKDYEVLFPGPYGPITIRYGDKQHASTQPTTQQSSESSSSEDASVKTNGNATPRISADGTLSFDWVKPPPRQLWGLFAVFAVAAFLCWKLGGNVLGALVCVALGVISIAYSPLLVYLAVLALIIGAIAARKTIVQLIQGNQRVLEKSPPEVVEQLLNHWGRKQDQTTTNVVKSVVG